MLSFGAFAVMIAANLTVSTGPLGIIIWVLMGLLAGQMIYKWKQSIVTTTGGDRGHHLFRDLLPDQPDPGDRLL